MLSKEYIYVGDRLVAIEEPSASGQMPYKGTPHAVPGLIEAEDFDEGGEGVAYHDTDPGVANGTYRPGGVYIEPCGDVGGGFNVGSAWPTEWLEYTINVASAGEYLVEARVAYGLGSVGGTFHIEFDGVNTGSMTVPQTSGWQDYQTVRKTVNLTAGLHVMRLFMDTPAPNGGMGNFNYIRITSQVAGPSPTNLLATAQTQYKVHLTWSAPAGVVSRYQVERRGGGEIKVVAEPSGTIFDDITVIPGISYVYSVRAVFSSGGLSEYSNRDLATTIFFTEDPLVPKQTTVRALHITQLRQAVDAVRATAGLAPATWSPPAPQVNGLIYAAHVQDLRDNLAPALVGLQLPPPPPYDPDPSGIVRGLRVMASHVQQIRDRVK